MYTPQLKYPELSLEHRRPSSGRVYSHSRSPDSSAEARVALKKVAWVISELLETELAYLESLRDIKEGYYLPLLAEGKFDATTLDTVFSNITQLHAFHQTFSGELYRNQENLVGLANVFLEHAVDFEDLYVDFCTEHSLSIQTLEQERQLQTELWTSILACQSRLGHLLPLASYLLKPVQRVLKYQLLLQELVKGCTLAGLGHNESILDEDPTSVVKDLQSALERMIQVATHINEAKRRHELIGQLRASGLDVDQWGCLLLRDVFRLPAKKHACRLVLLFERAILLAKKFSYTGNNSAPNLKDLQSPSGEELQSVLEIRDIISCSNLMLIECIDKDPLAFHILPFNNPNAQKTLQAANAEVKQLWCREIKRVILENFDAAIPEKAKHLMLHMEDLCPRPKLSDSSSQMGLHSIDESEEEQAPRRKGSSVLTAIFKRRGRTARPSTKLQTSENPPALSSTAPNDSDGSYNPCDGSDADEDDSEHVALVQDAWNALMAKHSSSTVVTPTTIVTPLFPTTPTPSEKQQEVNGVEEDDEEDFRCIAVEINEERFAVDLVPPQKLPDFKPISPPKGWQNSLAHNPSGASIYIECQEVSQYDTVTFGRAYEQYIAKTRSMATLSPGEVDEILRPLLTLTEDRNHQNSPCATGETTVLNDEANDNRMPTLASSEDCSDASSSTSCTSPMSACQLVSRIAIDSAIGNANISADGDGGRVASPAVGRNYRPPQSRVATPPCPAKVTPRPSTASSISRNDAAKSPAVRKFSAPQVSTRTQHSKPPRNLGPSRMDVTPSLRSNQLVNGSGAKTTSRTSGTTTQPSKSPLRSTATSANLHNAEAASLCQGRFRAAVANLRPSGGQSVSVATNTVLSSRPNKPPRRTGSSTNTVIECKGGSERARTSTLPTPPVMSSASTMTSTMVRGQGHVKHLIDRFQNN